MPHTKETLAARRKHGGDYVWHSGFTKESAERRFWERVDKNGPIPQHRPELGACWIWTGTKLHSKKKTYYGKFSYGGDGTEVLAHRFSFFLHNGRWPKPYGCHHCDNGLCVNPNHLFEGDWRDNNRDMELKGRANHSGLAIGHSLPRDSKGRVYKPQNV